MKRIKSFTIVELIVVFLITSVLITLSAGVLITIFKSFELNLSKSNAKTESISLLYSLEKDMENNLLGFEYTNNEIRLKNNKGNIKYVFSDQAITRRNQNLKTELVFHLKFPEFLIIPNSKSIRIDLWSESSIDTLNIYYNFSNRFYCLENGYID